MRKNSIKTIVLASFCCVLLSFSSLAWKSDDRIDELFLILYRGGGDTSKQVQGYLTELNQLIPIDDIERQEKLLTYQCWNKDISSEGKKALALAFSLTHEAKFSQAAPSEIHTDLLLCKAYYLEITGQHTQALNEYTRAIDEAYKLENPKLIADGLSLRGSMLTYQGDFSVGLEDLITAQSLYENLHLEYWANANMNQLATSYRRMGDAKTAIQYFQTLKKAYIKEANPNEVSMINTQIAFALDELGEHLQALDYYQKSYHYWQQKNNILERNIIAVHMAGNLLKLGRVTQASRLLTQAEKTVTLTEDNAYSFLKLHLAQISLLNHQPNIALEQLKDAEKAFKLSNNQRGLASLYQLKASNLAQLGLWQQGYQALFQYEELHVMLNKKAMSENTSQMRARFDINQIEKENRLLVASQEQKQKMLDTLQENEYLQRIIIVLVAVILLVVSVFAFVQLRRKASFRRLALTDELTQLANRRHCYSQASLLLKRAIKNQVPFSVISFDIDHFKQVNDTWGHDVGDQVLVTLANICTQLMRQSDIIARVGGEEFLIILPKANKEQALEVANRIVTSIANADWQHLTPDRDQTISAGVASLSDETTLNQLLIKVDKGLYLAKSAGRNCVKQV